MSLKRVRLAAGRKAGDTRVFNDSDYYLPQDYVERFANEVRARPAGMASLPEESEESADVSGTDPIGQAPSLDTPDLATSSTPAPDAIGGGAKEPASVPAVAHVFESQGQEEGDQQRQESTDPILEGDPTDGSPDVDSTCTKNWKAAAADEKKRTWDIFEETGIFASACRHGLMLWVIDMVRSGELCVLCPCLRVRPCDS